MVKPGSDLARPQVRSESRHETWHQVDLIAYRGNGACECEDFEFHHRRDLEQGAAPGPEHRCKHIDEARAALLEHAIRQLSKTLPHHTPPA